MAGNDFKNPQIIKIYYYNLINNGVLIIFVRLEYCSFVEPVIIFILLIVLSTLLIYCLIYSRDVLILGVNLLAYIV